MTLTSFLLLDIQHFTSNNSFHSAMSGVNWIFTVISQKETFPTLHLVQLEFLQVINLLTLNCLSKYYTF